jgi:hypothetical protein
VSLLTVIVANRMLLMRAGLGERTLEAAATGTSIGMGVALVLSGWILYRQFGVFIPALTWLRTTLAAGAGFAVAKAIPHDSVVLAIIALAAGFGAALIVLVVTREIHADDWRALRRVVRRG